PGVHRLVEHRGAVSDLLEHQQRQQAGDAYARDGHAGAARAAHPAAEKTGDHRGEKAQQRDGQQQVRIQTHWFQPLSVPMSATLMLCRWRNSTTRMARPMAASAAATVSTKNTNTWPSMLSR